MRELLAGPPEVAAPRLLGALLSAGAVAVRLTEVEAYAGPADPASHAFRGPTPRTATMFGPPGHAYVYFSYGMHWCMNVVCGPAGRASAVLLRAGEVVAGLPEARGRRPRARDRDLARGPARLTKVLGITGADDGVSLLATGGPRLTLGEPLPATAVGTGPRVGVAGAADTAWRFWVAGDPTVSVYRPHVPRRRPPAAELSR